MSVRGAEMGAIDQFILQRTWMNEMKALCSDREAAALLGCGRSTIWRWASEGILPGPIRIGGLSRWKLSDLEAAIARADAQRKAA